MREQTGEMHLKRGNDQDFFGEGQNFHKISSVVREPVDFRFAKKKRNCLSVTVTSKITSAVRNNTCHTIGQPLLGSQQFPSGFVSCQLLLQLAISCS